MGLFGSKNKIPVKAVAAGYGFSAALREDGTVVAWGDNENGRCDVPVGLTGVKTITAGYRHLVALKEDGTVVAWGANDCEQCRIPAGLTGIKAISAGDDHTVLLKDDGTVVVLDRGYNRRRLPSILTRVQAIASGSHTVALKEDGTVVVWRLDYTEEYYMPTEWQVVRSGDEPVYSPYYFTGSSGIMAIAAGVTHTTALKKDGTVEEWGRVVPNYTPPGLDGVVAIKAGSSCYCTAAFRFDGSVVCWGVHECIKNGFPLKLTKVKDLAIGYSHMVALNEDGTLVAWGSNESGQCKIPKELR